MSFTKADIAAIVEAEGLDNLTAKVVRVKLEEKLGLEPGALKSKKEEISEMIDAVLEVIVVVGSGGGLVLAPGLPLLVGAQYTMRDFFCMRHLPQAEPAKIFDIICDDLPPIPSDFPATATGVGNQTIKLYQYHTTFCITIPLPKLIKQVVNITAIPVNNQHWYYVT